MIKYNILHNFISPITGRILAAPGYVLIGDSDGIAYSSSALIDLELDLIHLRQRYNRLIKSDFVMGFPNSQAANAQVLSRLPDGFMYNTAGIVSTTNIIPMESMPDLQYHYLWTGDEDNRPIEVQRIIIDNLPSFLTEDSALLLGAYNLWTGDSNSLNLGNPIQVLTLNIVNMADLPLNHFWLGNSGGRPEATLFEIITGTGLTGGPIRGNGTISIANTGVVAGAYSYASFTVNAQGQLLSATSNMDVIDDLQDQLQDILDQLSDIINQLGDINTQLGDIQTQLGDLQLQLGGLTISLAGALAAIAALQAAVSALQAAVAALEDRLDNLCLNAIPACGDVSFDNFKLINLADPEDPTDGVNLRTLQTHISNLRLNNITVDGDVSLNNYKITNLADGTDPTDAANIQTVNNIVNAAVIEGIGDITLEGFVIGGPPDPDTGVITTERGFTDLDMLSYRVTNLKQSPEEDFDAISMTFFWDLMHDEVEILWP